MSRFANLEFDERHGEPGRKADYKGTPIRDASYFLEQAKKAYLSGDFEVALRNYSRMLEHNSALFDGWFGQVRMLIELGEYEEALLWADKALELFPERPELLATKSVASNRSGALEKAMAYSDNAISHKGVSSYVWIARAEALLARKSKTAEHCLTNAVGIAGASAALVRLESGRVLLRSGECVKALDYLRMAATDLSKSALAWLELGRCQAALGLAAAEMTLTQCLSLRPNWDPAKMALNRYRGRGLLSRVKGGFRRLFGG